MVKKKQKKRILHKGPSLNMVRDTLIVRSQKSQHPASCMYWLYKFLKRSPALRSLEVHHPPQLAPDATSSSHLRLVDTFTQNHQPLLTTLQTLKLVVSADTTETDALQLLADLPTLLSRNETNLKHLHVACHSPFVTGVQLPSHSVLQSLQTLALDVGHPTKIDLTALSCLLPSLQSLRSFSLKVDIVQQADEAAEDWCLHLLENLFQVRTLRHVSLKVGGDASEDPDTLEGSLMSSLVVTPVVMLWETLELHIPTSWELVLHDLVDCLVSGSYFPNLSRVCFTMEPNLPLAVKVPPLVHSFKMLKALGVHVKLRP
eukprot:TRINITY_DN67944_c1_g5_i1.p1 TRINITY_DN67944_c1_g5~~TRINITY_DN67944_c1_g5_i1.p1  ORF type:complete len:316 (+),score=13.63 TRINITY_DN67944_c1_g5_i1:246-1193(+)